MDVRGGMKQVEGGEWRWWRRRGEASVSSQLCSHFSQVLCKQPEVDD